MSIHFPEVFHEFLDSLAFSPHCSDAQPIASLWKDTPCTTHNGTDGIKRSVSIYQAQTTKLTIIAFRQKIVSILREQAHVATDSVADAILGLTVKAATNGKERADYLGAFLKALKCVDVSHFIVLPAKAGNKPLTFDGYTLGSLNTSVLVSRCNRAGSDYAELYSNGLTGQFTIQSPEFKHVVHDYSHEAANLSNVSGVVWENLRLNYFERISRLHCEFMYSDLDRKQSLGATFGAHMLDVPNIRSSVGRFAESITIYLGFAGKGVGYVVPERGTVTVVQPGPESEAFKQFTEHREKYRLSEIGDSELGRTLFACAGFCQQAVRFLEAERPNDAALYATVCLEHLFSEKQSTSEFVCSRAAVPTRCPSTSRRRPRPTINGCSRT